MKKLLYLIVLFIITFDCSAKCSSEGLYFWPSGNTINPNSIIVVDGYAKSEAIIKGIGSTYKAYLISGNQKIKLDVQVLLIGQFSLTQVILKPQSLLSKGKLYQLVIENIATLENVAKGYNEETKKNGGIFWKVESENDITKPVWKTKPSFKKNEIQYYGCGPAMSADFSFSASDASLYLIKSIVKDISTGKEITYYLTPEAGIISVGHDMCSGAFDFKKGEKYEARFQLMDASGNFSDETSDKIQFNSPF